MTRNLKALGLAVLVVIASAIAASTASAQNGKLTSDGPATLTGTQTGAATENALLAFGGETQCPNATYTGHQYNVTPHEPIPSGAESVTITPHYGLCTALGVLATVDMNGCDYVLHLEETTGADKYGVKSTVLCPVGQHITLTLFTSTKKHGENISFCHITITEKAEGYSGLSATDTTNGKVDISGTITGISADKKSPTGSILCPEETTTTASLKQDITVEGKNAVGEATPIGISHEPPPNQGRLTSDGLVTLIGIQTGAAGSNAFAAFGLTTECPEATYTGHQYNVTPHASMPSGALSVTVTSQYGRCTTTGFLTTVDMNGCDYALHLGETTGTDEYAARTTIVCSGGNHIKVTLFASEAKHLAAEPFCTITITDNEAGYAGLTARDTTNGGLDITGAAKAITADKAGLPALCPTETTEAAQINQDLGVEGKSQAGNATAISLSDGVPPGTGKLTSDGPATLTGTQTGAATENALLAFGGETQCPNATYTGHQYNVTPHEPIPSGAESVTITPHYGLCTALGVLATVDMNGCDYVLHLEETTGADKYGVKSTALCPVGQHITLTLFTSTKKHGENISFCHITITEKAEGYSGLSATDTTNGKVDISGTITGISADKKSPTESILCPEEVTTTASLKQDITLEGKNALGEATGIGISHN